MECSGLLGGPAVDSLLALHHAHALLPAAPASRIRSQQPAGCAAGPAVAVGLGRSCCNCHPRTALQVLDRPARSGWGDGALLPRSSGQQWSVWGACSGWVQCDHQQGGAGESGHAHRTTHTSTNSHTASILRSMRGCNGQGRGDPAAGEPMEVLASNLDQGNGLGFERELGLVCLSTCKDCKHASPCFQAGLLG